MRQLNISDSRRHDYCKVDYHKVMLCREENLNILFFSVLVGNSAVTKYERKKVAGDEIIARKD